MPKVSGHVATAQLASQATPTPSMPKRESRRRLRPSVCAHGAPVCPSAIRPLCWIRRHSARERRSRFGIVASPRIRKSRSFGSVFRESVPARFRERELGGARVSARSADAHRLLRLRASRVHNRNGPRIERPRSDLQHLARPLTHGAGARVIVSGPTTSSSRWLCFEGGALSPTALTAVTR